MASLRPPVGFKVQRVERPPISEKNVQARIVGLIQIVLKEIEFFPARQAVDPLFGVKKGGGRPRFIRKGGPPRHHAVMPDRAGEHPFPAQAGKDMLIRLVRVLFHDILIIWAVFMSK